MCTKRKALWLFLCRKREVLITYSFFLCKSPCRTLWFWAICPRVRSAIKCCPRAGSCPFRLWLQGGLCGLRIVLLHVYLVESRGAWSMLASRLQDACTVCGGCLHGLRKMLARSAGASPDHPLCPADYLLGVAEVPVSLFKFRFCRIENRRSQTWRS